MSNNDCIVAYLSFLFKGNWKEIVNAMKTNYIVSFQKAKSKMKEYKVKYVSIISEKYPQQRTNLENPPIVLFYEGNYSLLNLKGILILSHINSENYKYLKNLVRNGIVPWFCFEWMSDYDYELLMKYKIPYVICSKTLKLPKNEYFVKMLKSLKALIISECINATYDFLWWQFPRLLLIYKTILLLSDYVIKSKDLIDFIKDNKIKLFALCHSNDLILKQQFSSISTISNTKKFQIVINYLNDIL